MSKIYYDPLFDVVTKAEAINLSRIDDLEFADELEGRVAELIAGHIQDDGFGLFYRLLDLVKENVGVDTLPGLITVIDAWLKSTPIPWTDADEWTAEGETLWLSSELAEAVASSCPPAYSLLFTEDVSHERFGTGDYTEVNVYAVHLHHGERWGLWIATSTDGEQLEFTASNANSYEAVGDSYACGQVEGRAVKTTIRAVLGETKASIREY